MNLLERIVAGEWGVGHGLISAGIIAAVWVFVPSYYAVALVSVATAVYWARREAVARETWDIRDWYLDSQLDAIVPILVSGIAILLRYL